MLLYLINLPCYIATRPFFASPGQKRIAGQAENNRGREDAIHRFRLLICSPPERGAETIGEKCVLKRVKEGKNR